MITQDSTVEDYRSRWRRFIAQRCRVDRPNWVELCDSNWLGWVNRVDENYMPVRIEALSREYVKDLFLKAIDIATQEDFEKLDSMYCEEKYEKRFH